MPSRKTMAILGTILRQTPKAICVRLHFPQDKEIHEEEMWFPISQIEEIHPSAENDEEFDKLVITEWIAKEKGLL